MSVFLGVDGGGTKTDFVLVDGTGRVLASHRAGSAYYLETGIDALEAMLVEGIRATLELARIPPAHVDFAFLGLPAHGEDSALLPRLNRIATAVLPLDRHRCGNDMVCGWAGALAGRDGINLVAGTGSIAYGELAGRQARAGGWGELFGDEGSAYWLAREGLALFSRMSDGRTPKGPLYELVRGRFALRDDLDLCAAIHGPPPLSRSAFADLAPVVAAAARAGDLQARQLLAAAARELASIVNAVADALHAHAGVPAAPLPVSYSGGLFHLEDAILDPLRAALDAGGRRHQFIAPILTPAAGAALYAARLAGQPLGAGAIATLARQLPARPSTDAGG